MFSINLFQTPSHSTSLSLGWLVERIFEFIISESPNCTII